jgi:hypothetical protein
MMPASAIPTIHGSACTAPSGSNPAADRGEDRHRPRDSLPLVECTAVSRAKDPKRPATGTSPLPAEPTARIAAILDTHSLLCRSSGGTDRHATTKTVAITETTSGCVLSLLPKGSRVAPTQSPVRGYAQMAKRQEAEQLDRFGHSFWISLRRSVCQHAAPRFGSCRTINHHTLEQWPNRGTDQSPQGNQTPDVRASRLRTSQSQGAALGYLKSSVNLHRKCGRSGLRAADSLNHISCASSQVRAPIGRPPSINLSTAAMPFGATGRMILGRGVRADGMRCASADSIWRRTMEAFGMANHFVISSPRWKHAINPSMPLKRCSFPLRS